MLMQGGGGILPTPVVKRETIVNGGDRFCVKCWMVGGALEYCFFEQQGEGFPGSFAAVLIKVISGQRRCWTIQHMGGARRSRERTSATKPTRNWSAPGPVLSSEV